MASIAKTPSQTVLVVFECERGGGDVPRVSQVQASDSNFKFVGTFGPTSVEEFGCHPLQIDYQTCWGTCVGSSLRVGREIFATLLVRCIDPKGTFVDLPVCVKQVHVSSLNGDETVGYRIEIRWSHKTHQFAAKAFKLMGESLQQVMAGFIKMKYSPPSGENQLLASQQTIVEQMRLKELTSDQLKEVREDLNRELEVFEREYLKTIILNGPIDQSALSQAGLKLALMKKRLEACVQEEQQRCSKAS